MSLINIYNLFSINSGISAEFFLIFERFNLPQNIENAAQLKLNSIAEFF